MVTKQKQRRAAATKLQRPPINEMTSEQLATWIRATRTALQQKMQRERNYLDRRAVRNTHTPTDDAYEQDQRLEADLIALLDEMAASFAQQGRNT